PSFQSLHTCTSSLCPVPSPPPAPPSPYTTLFRSTVVLGPASTVLVGHRAPSPIGHRLCGLHAQECVRIDLHRVHGAQMLPLVAEDRKSTRLNSSHVSISYAVFCLKKKKDTSLM